MTTDTLTLEGLQNKLAFMQIKQQRLVSMTAMINLNTDVNDLIEELQKICSFELSVRRIAFYFRGSKQFSLKKSHGCEHLDTTEDLEVIALLSEHSRPSRLDHSNVFLKQFEYVIPVMHKAEPLAYVLVGDMDTEMPSQDDVFDTITFIQTLTNIVAVAIENKRLFKKQVAQEALNREIELGRQMQRLLIPDELHDADGVKMDSIYQPHFGVGGDYFDYIRLPNGKHLVCIADISGKGVGAALLMANVQAHVHALAEKGLKPKEFVEQLNRSVLRITKGDRFITFFGGVYDDATGELIYVNAGHNPPLFCVGSDPIVSLRTGCTILGNFEELPTIEVGRYQLKERGLLVLFTDGLTDLVSPDGAFLNSEDVVDFCDRNRDLSPELFNQELLQHIDTFTGGSTSHPDDISVFTIELIPS